MSGLGNTLPLIDAPSPNHGERPAGGPLDTVILHYTGMQTGKAALDRLRDEAAQVSAHYLIEEDGRIFALVPEQRRAWHAGKGFWAGDRDINSRSIGIEIVNPGHEWGYRPFPERQIGALERLLRDISLRWEIPGTRYLAHSDVAPDRKEDPGELFPWLRLSVQGFGLWPDMLDAPESRTVLRMGTVGGEVRAYQAALATFGYEIDANGQFDAWTRVVTIAFQRHFQPGAIGSNTEGCADVMTVAVARWLAERAERA